MSLRIICPSCRELFDFGRANNCPKCDFNYLAHFRAKQRAEWKSGQLETPAARENDVKPSEDSRG